MALEKGKTFDKLTDADLTRTAKYHAALQYLLIAARKGEGAYTQPSLYVPEVPK
jgi:hypothetical protein